MASSTYDSISTTSKTISGKPYDSMKFYPDVFDILDYQHENDNHLNEKQQRTKIEAEFNLNYQFDNTLSNIVGDEEEQEFIGNESINTSDNDDDDDDEICEERVLSQRLSQLSTMNDDEREPSVDRKRRRSQLITTTTSPQSIKKKFRTDIEKDVIPDYLLSTNKIFDPMIHKIVDMVSVTDMEDIRQMAFFMHQISHSNILYDLWSTYLRSGKGLLKEHETEEQDEFTHVDQRYWPKHVKSIVESQKINEKDEHIACEHVVNQYISKYHEKMLQYEKQLNDKKQYLLHYWTIELEKTIEKFIQQYGTASVRIECEFQQAILMHEYEDEIIQRKSIQHPSTEYQKQVAQRLYDTELQLETAKSELIEYQQRIICNKPPVLYDSLEILLPSSIHTLSNIHLRQELFNRYEKLIQQTKTDLMTIDMASKQAKIYQYQILFNENTKEMEQNKKDIPKVLDHLIGERSLNMKKKLKLMSDFTINSSIRSLYSELETMQKDKNKKHLKQIGFLPSLIIDRAVAAMHHLTDQQLGLLRRGPAYVAPCQLHVSSSFSTIDNMIMKQYTPLKHQLAVIFDKYKIDPSRTLNFQTDLKKALKDLYSIPLSNNIYQRALYEKQLIQSIDRFLKTNNLILRRTADEKNSFYLGTMTNFIDMSNQYMENNTDIYDILINLNDMNLQDVQEQLKKKYLLINSQFKLLLDAKKINIYTYKKIQIKIENIKLPYLYFLPDISTTNSVQVKPMISTHRSVTSNLAQYLKEIIRPLISSYMNRTRFINECDFMRKLLDYTNNKENHLHPTTLFATIKITNFHTMISHQSMIAALLNFFTDHLATNKVRYQPLETLKQYQSISIETIKKLTELYLENNIFYYHGKIYQFIKGGPNSLLFNDILSTIYLFHCEKFLFDDPRLKTTFYGRYKNQLFFTWNRSKEELMVLLNSFKEKYQHIHMETSMGRCVQFLNAQIENRHGHLYTCVYHDSQVAKYTLPYVVGHTKLNHRCWFRSALLRAVYFCSNFLDFKQEEIYLEMTCLANGYSINFIETQLKHFYLRFNAEKIRFCLDRTVYEKFRDRIFSLINQQCILSETQEQLDDNGYLFHFSYPYDYGPYNQFNEKFHDFCLTYFKDDEQLSHKDTKIILNTQQLYSLNTLLAQQKPSHELLKTTKKITF